MLYVDFLFSHYLTDGSGGHQLYDAVLDDQEGAKDFGRTWARKETGLLGRAQALNRFVKVFIWG